MQQIPCPLGPILQLINYSFKLPGYDHFLTQTELATLLKTYSCSVRDNTAGGEETSKKFVEKFSTLFEIPIEQLMIFNYTQDTNVEPLNEAETIYNLFESVVNINWILLMIRLITGKKLNYRFLDSLNSSVNRTKSFSHVKEITLLEKQKLLPEEWQLQLYSDFINVPLESLLFWANADTNTSDEQKRENLYNLYLKAKYIREQSFN